MPQVIGAFVIKRPHASKVAEIQQTMYECWAGAAGKLCVCQTLATVVWR